MRILFWFRKDLRLADNLGLHEAHRDAGGSVVPFYASDRETLGRPDLAPIRVQFVLDALADLARACERAGSCLALAHGPAAEAVLDAARLAQADAVYWNDEYEPAQIRRDAEVESRLRAAGLAVRRFHDRLLVPPGLVMNAEGRPFVVYGAFRRACERLPFPEPLAEVTRLATHELPSRRLATLAELGLVNPIPAWPSSAAAAHARLERFVEDGLPGYATGRDLLGSGAISRLSADLRFGTLSPRTVAAAVRAAARANPTIATSAEKYVAELRWRDFYAHVLYHFPHAETAAFQERHTALPWPGRDEHFEAWRRGLTGYPIVDAAMRELSGSGFMHNRARMIVASFLTKDLLIDWRRGERHFMNHLVDGDPASNNGGWQWAASTGTDAQPWFRIFNPVLQGRRFDPDGAYVRRWVPELERVPSRWIHEPWNAPGLDLAGAGVTLGETYPAPIVDHGTQRERALEMYQARR